MTHHDPHEISEVGLHAGTEALAAIVRVCGTLPTIESKSIASMLALAFLNTVIEDSTEALGPEFKKDLESLSAIFAQAGMAKKMKDKLARGEI